MAATMSIQEPRKRAVRRGRFFFGPVSCSLSSSLELTTSQQHKTRPFVCPSARPSTRRLSGPLSWPRCKHTHTLRDEKTWRVYAAVALGACMLSVTPAHKSSRPAQRWLKLAEMNQVSFRPDLSLRERRLPTCSSSETFICAP